MWSLKKSKFHVLYVEKLHPFLEGSSIASRQRAQNQSSRTGSDQFHGRRPVIHVIDRDTNFCAAFLFLK